MEGTEVTESSSNERIHHQRPSAPRRPKPYGTSDKENEDSLSNGDTRLAKKLSTANEGGTVPLARAGETILETFYGMLYICEDETKEWKLAADGFIPLCFIQERGNANKPFKVIAVHGSTRVMEVPVTKDTKCTQNKAFVKWNESQDNMFGVRFAKESQADQFYSAMYRMKSTLLKTAELFKQPERKAMVSQISDPTVESIAHTKTSLIVKLPNKETTVMSVPGLITMDELFCLICKKEGLTPHQHELLLPKIGSKEVKFEPDTVLGSLKIREVSINYIGGTANDSAVGAQIESSKGPQASAATIAPAPPRPQPYNNRSHQDQRPATKHTPTFERKITSLSASDEQLDKVKKDVPVAKDSGKMKRRAPRPPQRPERPKSMPIPRPRKVESEHATPPVPRQAKKRQAPARPPVPKVLRGIPSSNGTNTSDVESAATNERLPPIFCPPPPPDDVPPPLDECEYPVSPLSDDDLHDTAWISSGGNLEPGEMTTSFKTVPPDMSLPRKPFLPQVSEDRDIVSPEPIPLKFLLPTSETPPENADDIIEREGQSSRISFVGDSRSSSVDISSDNEILTSPMLEAYKPLAVESSMELPDDDTFDTDITTTAEQEPQSISQPSPPSGFTSGSMNNPLDNPLDNSERIDLSARDDGCGIEGMVIPPPPLMFDDPVESQDVVSKESDMVIESDVNFSIPPPSDFAFEVEAAKPPAEFDDEETSTPNASKKKLGLNNDMFPWLSEPQPVFQAEVSNTEMEFQSEVPSEDLTQPAKSYGIEEQSKTESCADDDVLIHEVSPVESRIEKLEVKSSSTNKDQEPNDPDTREIPIPELYNGELSKQLNKREDEREDKMEDERKDEREDERGLKSPDHSVVPDTQAIISIPSSITEGEGSQQPDNKEHYRRISSDEGSQSSSSAYKTPFDDLEGIENSESSLNSEVDEDFPDLKITRVKDSELHSEVINENQRETTTNESVNESTGNLELTVKEKEANIDDEEQVHQSQESPTIKSGDPDIRDESKSGQTVGAKSTVITTDHSVVSASSPNNIATEQIIESSIATPIAIPLDILFSQSLGPSTNSDVAVLQGNDKDKHQAQLGLKRPVSSGFKTQSWADIKKREKQMERERQKKSLSKITQQHSLPLETTRTSSAKTNSKEFKTTTSLKEKESTDVPETPLAKPVTAPIVSTSTEGNMSSSIAPSKSKENAHSPQRTTPHSYVSSAVERKSSTVAPNLSQNNASYSQNIIATSSGSLVSSSTERVSSSTTAPSKPKHYMQFSPSTNVTSSNSLASSMERISSTEVAPSKSKSNTPFLQSSHSTTANLVSTALKEQSSSTVATTESKSNAAHSHQSTTMKSSDSTFSTTIDEKSTTVASISQDDASSSQSAKGVVMRKKTDSHADTLQKRMSVHDMMRMFQDSAAEDTKMERKDSTENSPRQSPALRLIEEKMSPTENSPRQSPALRLIEEKMSPNRPRSSSASTPATKPMSSDSRLGTERENNSLRETTKPGNKTEKVPKVQNETSSVKVSKETSESKQNEPDSSEDRKPRTNSLNPRHKYEVLFPKERKTSVNSEETSRSTDSRKQVENTSDFKDTKRHSLDENLSTTKQIHDEGKHKQSLKEESSKTKHSVERKKAESIDETKPRQSIDEKKPKPKLAEDKKEVKDTSDSKLAEDKIKESSSAPDSLKRPHSMPINLVENTSTSSQFHGKNLKILMAPQISDIDVVPKGRVAAMMAALKKDEE